MRQIHIVVALISTTAFLFSSCKKDEPIQPPASTIQLSFEDASCTEAWLKVSLSDADEPRTVAIRQDGQRVLSIRMPGLDSVLIVEGLLPHRQYIFLAERLSDSTAVDVSPPVQATTMDTTSHSFIWEMDTLGVTASYLNDVAIVNDTLGYAVGEMYVRDSTGQIDPTLFNLARWDGRRWDLQRVTWNGYPAPLRFVFLFNERDIWFGMGYLIHWDGVAYRQVEVPIFYGTRSNKMWGKLDGQLYAVGNSGTIAYSPNHEINWQGVENGTTLDVRDIWGATDPRSGQTQILALASDFTVQTQESEILQVTGGSTVALNMTGLSPDLSGIWFVPGRRYYAVGAGVHQKRMLTDSSWQVYPPGVVTRFSSSAVRGQGLNDVFVVGSFGEVVHYNGYSWHRYFADVPLPSGAYASVAVRGNLVMAVGDIGGTRAIVLIGRR